MRTELVKAVKCLSSLPVAAAHVRTELVKALTCLSSLPAAAAHVRTELVKALHVYLHFQLLRLT